MDCGEIDLALMLRPPFALPRELRWHHLSTDPYYLVVNETVRGDDWEAILREQPFVRYDRTSFGGRAVERFLRTQRIQVNEAVELDELGGMVQAVASGLGVALMPVVPPHAPLPPACVWWTCAMRCSTARWALWRVPMPAAVRCSA